MAMYSIHNSSLPLLSISAATFLALTTTVGSAQPTAFTYQGSLSDVGGPVNGFFDFTVSVWDAAGAGSQQGSTLTNTAVEVVDGLFTVTLDPGPGVFNGSDRWLEVGVVTNGGGAFTILSPRQPIHSAPYAIKAAQAANAQALSGTVSAAQLSGTISSNNIGAGSITSMMLADGAVGTAQLADAAVTGDKIAPNLLQDTEDVLQSFQAQFRIDDPDGTGLQVWGTLTAPVVFTPPFPSVPELDVEDPTATVSAVTSNGFVMNRSFTGSRLFGEAHLPSSAIINGNPAMAFTHLDPIDGTRSLRYSRAEDAAGVSFPEAVVVDGTVPTTGWAPSLAVIAGRPAVAYHRFHNSGGTNLVELRFVVASDPDGTSWDPPITVLSDLEAPNGFTAPCLAEVAGAPAIAFCNPTTQETSYVRANDAQGQTWGSPVTIDQTGIVPPSLTVIDGRPALAYTDQTNVVTLRYVRANDPTGSSWPAPTIVDSLVPFEQQPGFISSLHLVNGHPAIAYEVNHFGSTPDAPMIAYIRAEDPQGTAWGTRVIVNSASGMPSGTVIDLGTVGTHPAIAFTVNTTNVQQDDLFLALADDVEGASWNTPVRLNRGQVPARIGDLQSLTLLDLGGTPAISYHGRTLTHPFVNFLRLPTEPLDWTAYVLQSAYPILARSALLTHTALEVSDGAVTPESHYASVRTQEQTGFDTLDLSALDQGQLTFTGDFEEIFQSAPTVEFDDPAVETVSTSESGYTASVSVGSLVIDASNNPGTFVSMTDLNGLPAMAYYAAATGELRFTRALNATATEWSGPVTIDNGDHAGRFVSLTVIAGHPAVAYYRANGSFNDLLYRRAVDPFGTSWTAPFTLSSGESFSTGLTNGHELSLLEIAGAPAIAYREQFDLKYRRGTDAEGTAWGAPVTINLLNPNGISMEVVNGRPAVTFTTTAGFGVLSDFYYVRALDSTGSSWGPSQLVREASQETVPVILSFVPFVTTNVTRTISYGPPTRLEVIDEIPHAAARRLVLETFSPSGVQRSASSSHDVAAAEDGSGQNWSSAFIGLGGGNGDSIALAQLGGSGRAAAVYTQTGVLLQIKATPNSAVQSGVVEGEAGAVLGGALDMITAADGVCLAYHDETHQRVEFLRLPLSLGSYLAFDDTVVPVTAARALMVADQSIGTDSLLDSSVTAEKLNLGGEPNQVLTSTGSGLTWTDLDLQLSGGTLSILPGGNTADLTTSLLPRNQSSSYDSGTLTFVPGTQLDLEGVISIGGPGQTDNDIIGFDGLAESLFWNNSQSRFEMTDDIYASGNMVAADHLLQSAQSFSYNIAGNAMVVRDHGETYFRSSLGYISQEAGTTTISVFGELNLPEGATITGATFYYYDNSATGEFSAVTGRVRRRAFGSTSAENVVVFEAAPPPGGVSSSVRALNHTSVSSSRTKVRNNLFQYWVYADVSSTSPGDGNLRIYGFRVTYTLQTLLP